ncbi:hypothetical protein L1987_32008 [Smallanthus sonchifolius]|uniref:Uncharacterized protein n=1 Tax=Smallanthus sonchifolius TaxID=185202 RepID=A0ACB9I8K8_9ASTR|nr:hypothetical protein L1987_32008 [Smallanthus sonchifolius]
MENLLRDDRSEGPPWTRLLTDTNPNENFVTASPELTVSSDSSADRFEKKTRELPNLSDCHGCAVRINYTNPRERLQPLDSMWRIVLLCKNCTKRVNSSELCPYCFSAVIDEYDCFKCRDCQHSIHKDCVARYSLRSGLSVCVDCWIPDAFANLVRARKMKFRIRNNECCEQAATFPESRASVGGTNEPELFLEEVERKVAAAGKASENALRKAVVAKNAVGLAKGVLSVVASRKVAGGCETTVVDDADLAVLLHRVINSSLRISKYACLRSFFERDDALTACYSRRRAGKKKIILMNSSTLDAPLICYSRRCRKRCLRNSASMNAPLICYSRRRSGCNAGLHDKECECFICKTSEQTDEHVSISSADLKACDRGSNSKNGFNGNNGQGNDAGRIAMKPHRYLLKYYRIGKGEPRHSVSVKNSDCSYFDFANLYTEGMTNTRNSANDNECHEICEKIDDSTNRFLLKYKRISRSKKKISCKVEEFSTMLPLNHPMESTTLSDSRPCFSSQGEL